jgi:hypothetical protein
MSNKLKLLTKKMAKINAFRSYCQHCPLNKLSLMTNTTAYTADFSSSLPNSIAKDAKQSIHPESKSTKDYWVY